MGKIRDVRESGKGWPEQWGEVTVPLPKTGPTTGSKVKIEGLHM